MSVKEQPLVSVGVPTYNRPKNLRILLESLIKQSYQNLEIIVSDNCSPESETETIVRQLMASDSRIKYFRQEKNIGMFYNFKFVFDVSHGDFFTWAADDDVRSSEYIEVCLEEFHRAEQSSQLLLVNTFSQLIDPVQGQVIKVDQGCTTVGLPAPERYKKYISSIYKEQAGIGDLIYGVIKRDAVSKAMAIQPNIVSWDHFFLAQLALDGEFYTIPLALMSSAPGGMSSSKSVAQIAKIQLIENPFFISKPGWATVICFRRKIWNSIQLSLPEKLALTAWTDWYYLTFYTSRKIKKFIS